MTRYGSPGDSQIVKLPSYTQEAPRPTSRFRMGSSRLTSPLKTITDPTRPSSGRHCKHLNKILRLETERPLSPWLPVPTCMANRDRAFEQRQDLRAALSLNSTGQNNVPHSLKMWRTLLLLQAVRAGSVSGPCERTSAAFVPNPSCSKPS
jgi:hypothetical protein